MSWRDPNEPSETTGHTYRLVNGQLIRNESPPSPRQSGLDGWSGDSHSWGKAPYGSSEQKARTRRTTN